jgi:hypothetical protein
MLVASDEDAAMDILMEWSGALSGRVTTAAPWIVGLMTAGRRPQRSGFAWAAAAWTSMAGGHIDRLLRLDTKLAPQVEGGPVLDAAGGLLGMSARGGAPW